MENKSKVELPSIKVDGFQDYISMGYLALLFLGILRETIYYRILGINILNYSSLIDVLLSPVSLLTEHIILIIALIVITALFTYFLNRKESKEKKTFIYWLFASTPMFFSVLFGMIIGNSVFKSTRIKNEIKVAEHKANHQILFNDNEKIDVKIIGQNSDYVFYVTESDDQISISPVKGNIKKIEKLKEDKE